MAGTATGNGLGDPMFGNEKAFSYPLYKSRSDRVRDQESMRTFHPEKIQSSGDGEIPVFFPRL